VRFYEGICIFIFCRDARSSWGISKGDKVNSLYEMIGIE
jgi:hypothetical protein